MSRADLLLGFASCGSLFLVWTSIILLNELRKKNQVRFSCSLVGMLLLSTGIFLTLGSVLVFGSVWLRPEIEPASLADNRIFIFVLLGAIGFQMIATSFMARELGIIRKVDGHDE